MEYTVTIKGFKTADEARGFVSWFEGQGEQDETLPEWLDRENESVRSVQTLMSSIKPTPTGWEFKLDIERV